MERARRAGRDARRPPRRARRRRRRRSRRLLRRDLPARGPGRPGADDARRRRSTRAYGGKTGIDLAAGQELRRRLPPAGRRARRPRDARHAARRRSSPRATPRSLKTALIAGGALWQRIAADEPVDEEVDLRLRALQALDRRRRRARRRPPPGAQPRPHRSATRSRPRPATRATATARRSALGLLAALELSGPGGAARAGRRAARARTACRPAPRASTRRAVHRRQRARQEAHAARACRSCSSTRRAPCATAPTSTPASWRPPWRSCADEPAPQPHRGACTASTSTCSAAATPRTTAR